MEKKTYAVLIENHKGQFLMLRPIGEGAKYGFLSGPIVGTKTIVRSCIDAMSDTLGVVARETNFHLADSGVLHIKGEITEKDLLPKKEIEAAHFMTPERIAELIAAKQVDEASVTVYNTALKYVLIDRFAKLLMIPAKKTQQLRKAFNITKTAKVKGVDILVNTALANAGDQIIDLYYFRREISVAVKTTEAQHSAKIAAIAKKYNFPALVYGNTTYDPIQVFHAVIGAMYLELGFDSTDAKMKSLFHL